MTAENTSTPPSLRRRAWADRGRNRQAAYGAHEKRFLGLISDETDLPILAAPEASGADYLATARRPISANHGQADLMDSRAIRKRASNVHQIGRKASDTPRVMESR